MQGVGSDSFRLTFDPCNAYFAGAEPLLDWWNALACYIPYVHIKDGYQLEPSQEGPQGWVRFTDEDRHYTTCSLGDGAINWPGLLAQLYGDGYDSFYTLEPHTQPGIRDAAWEHAADVARRWYAEMK